MNHHEIQGKRLGELRGELAAHAYNFERILRALDRNDTDNAKLLLVSMVGTTQTVLDEDNKLKRAYYDTPPITRDGE